MIRTRVIALLALLCLQGCAAIVPVALIAIEAATTAATVTETVCRSGEVLTSTNPTMLDGHPVLQTAEHACEALAP